MMRRRDFITLLGGAGAAWPLAARAQQQSLPVIGSISPFTEAEWSARMAAFRAGLNESGFIEGKSVTIEYRWAGGQFDRLPDFAVDLVRHNVALIFASGNVVAIKAAMAATRTIPIVFTSGADPVSAGVVASLDRPGGNVTGVSLFATALTAKRLELLREMLPAVDKVAFLVNPNNPATLAEDTRALPPAARQLGLQTFMLNAADDSEIERAFITMAEQHVSAVLVGSDSLFLSQRVQIAALALRHSIPVISSAREGIEAGAIMTYGPDQGLGYRQAGFYAGRILKGEKAGNLPVQQPTKFELLINLKAAKAMGFAIAESFLARADEVIE